MYSRLTASLLVGYSVALLSLSAAPQQQLQPQPSSTHMEIGVSSYDQVLDRLLPAPRWSDFERGTILSFWLRFQPGLDPALGNDSQIKVVLFFRKAPHVEYLSTDRRVATVVNNLLETNPQAQPDDIVSKLVVSRKTLSATGSQIIEWQHGLLQAISSELSGLPAEASRVYDTGSEHIAVDASSYDVWYSEGQTEFHYKATGVGDRSPFIKWADAFRSEIIAALKQSR
jgi:hypothetical protein